MPILTGIRIYPIKSFEGVSVAECRVLPSGALEYDRRLSLVDSEGSFVNGKRAPAIHRLRTSFDLKNQVARLSFEASSPTEFHLVHELDEMARWISQQLGLVVRLRENVEQGFPDDLDSPGPTVVGEATLREVASWFSHLTFDSVRRRFRANLEVSGVEPFWEDRLCARAGSQIPFRIGTVEFLGTNPCQRCVVPSRDPDSGEPIPGFSKTFAARREASIPAWAPLSRFDHFYRLAVNTKPATASHGWLRVGDELVTGD